MTNILIAGGGFGGVVAAERLARALDAAQHQITLVSRTRRFTFYPALVRLAFGEAEPEDISYDLRETLVGRGVRFVEATVARVNPFEQSVSLTGGDFAAEIEGRAPQALYEHEVTLVVDAGGKDSVYLHKKLWDEGEKSVSWGRFWSWAKRVHERYWRAKHS
ncbi:MAG: hypothetical protein M3444_01215 [Acidobacteriota bacterium]|nr:hypothetical protein [Acidobacteriota bacterium]MDQ5835903.1 hypothetical protein [Acidobacteriota bacterium]